MLLFIHWVPETTGLVDSMLCILQESKEQSAELSAKIEMMKTEMADPYHKSGNSLFGEVSALDGLRCNHAGAKMGIN